MLFVLPTVEVKKLKGHTILIKYLICFYSSFNKAKAFAGEYLMQNLLMASRRRIARTSIVQVESYRVAISMTRTRTCSKEQKGLLIKSC